MIEKGQLSLDAKLTDYLLGLPYDEITIQRLLSHTAGLYSYNTTKN